MEERTITDQVEPAQAAPDKKPGSSRKVDWMTAKWKPMMAITYMAMNIFDFIIGPIFFNVIQAYTKQPIVEWNSLTMSSGGMVHLAFGAILGVTAWKHVEDQKKDD